jgi:hypothetical protein
LEQGGVVTLSQRTTTHLPAPTPSQTRQAKLFAERQRKMGSLSKVEQEEQVLSMYR